MTKSKLLTIRADEDFIKLVDEAVKSGIAKSRADLIKKSMNKALKMTAKQLDSIVDKYNNKQAKRPKPRTRYTANQLRQAEELLNQKNAYLKVSEITGIALQTLYERFPRSSYPEVQNTKTFYSQSSLMQCKEMIESGMSIKEVSIKTGVSEHSLRYRFPKSTRKRCNSLI